jgi:methyl-accepting chemotaxis protein
MVMGGGPSPPPALRAQFAVKNKIRMKNMNKNKLAGFFGRSQRSLAFRCNLIIGVALFMVSVASTYVGSVFERRSLLKGMESQAARLAELLAVSVANPLFTFNQENINSAVKSFSSDSSIRFVQIKDSSGKVMAGTGEAKEAAGMVVVQRPSKVGNEVVGAVSLGLSTDSVEDRMKESWKILLGKEAVTFLLIFSLLFSLLRWLVTRPLEKMNRLLQEAQESNDLTMRVELQRKDELGAMADLFNRFIDKLEGIVRSIGQDARLLGRSAAELTSVSQQMSSSSGQTASQANVVSAASEQVSKNVQTVAAGAEEMSASIGEISKNTADAARVAKEAVDVAENTNQTITKLGASSAEIGNVIKVITSIAGQTNLLALNATIEAARAGEAGKGFAVVANEVKELAKQTGAATEDISAKIAAIQHDTQGAVSAIQQIGGIITQVNDIANTIASAVEEQSVTTNEMSRNVVEAAKGSNEIVQNITGVAQAAQNAANGAVETQQAAQELARLATELENLVGQFKYNEIEADAQPSMRGNGKIAVTAPAMLKRPSYRPADFTVHPS